MENFNGHALVLIAEGDPTRELTSTVDICENCISFGPDTVVENYTDEEGVMEGMNNTEFDSTKSLKMKVIKRSNGDVEVVISGSLINVSATKPDDNNAHDSIAAPSLAANEENGHASADVCFADS